LISLTTTSTSTCCIASTTNSATPIELTHNPSMRVKSVTFDEPWFVCFELLRL
jgi:hypothetical protein